MTETLTIDKERMPKHIAIIMDGNGRWATQRNQHRSYGHQAGVETIRKITSECVRLGVKYLTLYTFSTENWNRPSDEVAALMGLVLTALEEDIFMTNNVRFHVIGDMSRLPEEVRQKLEITMEHTRNNTNMTVTAALSYSSRWEMTKTIKEIAADVKDGKLAVDDINEKMFSSRLLTNFAPDPELLIRTGGEFRVSNYLLWQISYSELYFCDTFWPDFDEECLHRAIAVYQSRQRRFGLTEEQIERGSLI